MGVVDGPLFKKLRPLNRAFPVSLVNKLTLNVRFWPALCPLWVETVFGCRISKLSLNPSFET